MYKLGPYIFSVFVFFLLAPLAVRAQEKGNGGQDTFFLAKKKGLLGRFGKSISHTVPPDDPPERLANAYLKFKGKFIRSIILARVDFGSNVYDTCEVQSTLGTRLANTFHRKTGVKVMMNNLFFRVGDKVFPSLLADNERYLRDLVYLQDARILVEYSETSTDSVDVVVITKDIFSLGGKLVIDSRTKGRAELKDENIFGSGNRLLISGYYETPRNPNNGFGAEFVKRNIGGSFIDLTAGYQNYRSAFNYTGNQETDIYARIEKPLVTPYKPTTGALEWGYFKTRNAYQSDSLYNNIAHYQYFKLDGWLGYRLDNKKTLYTSQDIGIHSFAALRGFMQRFQSFPYRFKDSFDFRYTDFTGTLASINIFRQTFYRARFIYGFGRSEDIPEGFSIVLTGGYLNSIPLTGLHPEDRKRSRPYAGLDLQLANVRGRGAYFNYTFRAGGYYYRKRFEDVDLLLNIEHFSRLKKLGRSWYQRTFLTTGITAQANPVLNSPLFLNSEYGLPYLDNGNIQSDLRVSLKAESVFYNTTKILGFRLAPFVFGDMSLLKRLKMGLNKSDLFGAVGGGIRTRNENLVFGTIELKGYYFPRTNGNMNSWKIELNSNVRFRYRSNFIQRPDFIIAN